MFPQNRPSRIMNFFVSRDEPRLRAGWRLLIHGILVLFLTMIMAFFISIGLFIAGVSFSTSTEGLPKIFDLIISFPPILLATAIARTVIDHRTIRSLGFNLDRRMIPDLIVGFFISSLMIGWIFLTEWGVGWLDIKGGTWMATPTIEWIPNLLGSFGYFIVIGFQEELLFRGYQLQNLVDGLDLRKGVIFSSIFFALAHIFNPHSSILSTLGLFASGLFLAYAWTRTRQLWLAIGLHIGWNFFEGVIFSFPVSGTDTFRILSTTVSGPTTLTGGAFGPEAGLILLPALAVGVGLVWIYTRSRSQEEPDPSLADALFSHHITK
jgi:membrane protease YdiL (CAAX protease family)